MNVPMASKVAGAALLALFPAFFVYHYGVSHNWHPPVLGGLFSPVVVIFALPLALGLVLTLVNRRLTLLDDPMSMGALALFAYATMWMAINISSDPLHPGHVEVASTLGAWVVLFCMGTMLSFEWRLLNWTMFLLWLLMAALAFSATDPRFLMAMAESEEGASYQGLARSMFVVSAFVSVLPKNIMLRLVLAGGSLVALFLLGARSELYGFLFAFGLTEFLVNRRSALSMSVFALAMLALVIAVASYLDVLGASRQLQVLDLETASSWRARMFFEMIAWEQVRESPMWGIYGGHWDVREGGYAHNALSAWVSLGLFGFVTYVGLTVLAAWRAFRQVLKDPQSPRARFTLVICSSTVLLILVAKSVFWPIPALAWGLMIAPKVKAAVVRRPISPRLHPTG